MAITNYGELKSELAEWLHHNGAKVTARAADMILMGESVINRELRLLDMIATQTGVLDTSTRTLALPERYAERITFRLDSPLRNLTYVAPDSLDAHFNEVDTTGEPKRYTVTDAIEFDRIPDAAYSYTLKYYRGYRLADDIDTNYLLTNYPQLYLFAAMRYGSIYIRKPELAMEIEPLLQREFASLKKAEAKRKGTAEAQLSTEIGRRAGYNIDTD